MKKTLLIKTGRNETFAPAHCAEPSLGDVLRTTPLLRALEREGHEVSWVTSKAALPLLERNPRISRLILDDPDREGNAPDPALFEPYDQVINLENEAKWIRFARECGAGEKHGWVGAAIPETLAPETPWQRALFSLAGRSWKGEEYEFTAPVRALSEAEHHSEFPTEFDVEFDVGFNWAVGPKWPGKAWSPANWRRLEERLSPRFSISWQRGLSSLDDYATWLSSCKTIITVDSLGLHLAIALRKRVLGLFGPSPASAVEHYGRGLSLSAEGGSMEALTVDQVAEGLEKLGAGA